ncbi:unnamed protein product, partial [Dibothriocephalus latus]
MYPTSIATAPIARRPTPLPPHRSDSTQSSASQRIFIPPAPHPDGSGFLSRKASGTEHELPPSPPDTPGCSPLRCLGRVINTTQSSATDSSQSAPRSSLPNNSMFLGGPVPPKDFQNELSSRLKRQLQSVSKTADIKAESKETAENGSSGPQKPSVPFTLPVLTQTTTSRTVVQDPAETGSSSQLTTELILASKSRLRQASMSSKGTSDSATSLTPTDSVPEWQQSHVVQRIKQQQKEQQQPPQQQSFSGAIKQASMDKRLSWAPSSVSRFPPLVSSCGDTFPEEKEMIVAPSLCGATSPMSHSVTNACTPVLSHDLLVKQVAELCADLSWAKVHLPPDQNGALADRINEARQLCLSYVDE